LVMAAEIVVGPMGIGTRTGVGRVTMGWLGSKGLVRGVIQSRPRRKFS
jgi:hypothetical protein